jgi:proteasome assembly chaperone (PAC2) family protein
MSAMSRRARPEDLLTVLRTPDLVDPVLIVQLDGWIDAGGSAADAMRRIRDATEPTVLARFDTEWLIDHRARRPTMHIIDGVNTGLDWPRIEMAVGHDLNDRDIVLLHGAEPDHNWRAFVEGVVGCATDLGVERMIGLGAYPAAVPHTRPCRLSVTASSVELANAGNYANASLDVPAGIESALELALAAAEIPSIGLWAQVPHYVSTSPYPESSRALIEGLVEAAGIEIDPGPLVERAAITRARLDQLIADEESHREMVAELERRHDEATRPGELPSSEDLASQIEQFLREQENE